MQLSRKTIYLMMELNMFPTVVTVGKRTPQRLQLGYARIVTGGSMKFVQLTHFNFYSN